VSLDVNSPPISSVTTDSLAGSETCIAPHTLRAGHFIGNLRLHGYDGQRWEELEIQPDSAGLRASAEGLTAWLSIESIGTGRWSYALSFVSERRMRLRLELELPQTAPVFHLIPGCLFGDNNHAMVRPNEFPTLHPAVEGNAAAAPLWEFRADRASHPVSMLLGEGTLAAISIDPYCTAQTESERWGRNGLYARLPGSCGVSLGYGNDPLTFINKGLFGPATEFRSSVLSTEGQIWILPAEDRRAAHRVIRELHANLRTPPRHRHGTAEATQALARSFAEVNWSDQWNNYCNLRCQVPADRELKPWRPLSEIGWTGGTVLAFPLMLAAELDPTLRLPKDGPTICDEIAAARNPASGLLFDTVGMAITRGSDGTHQSSNGGVNSWWSGFLPETRDRHCAYTNGQAALYLLKAADWIEPSEPDRAAAWRETASYTLDTVVGLQREDGNLGYLYDTKSRAVVDWDGFAGCWFAAALALGGRLLRRPDWLAAAERAVEYYGQFVRQLACWGTPMDTWRSIDSEAAVAFLEATLQLHLATGEKRWLEWMRDGAEYEFLWRYAYPTRPEHEPLKSSGWNSCGGSITSISNPHVHPMSLLCDRALCYLAQATGDGYYQQRADEAIAWALQSMELYPEIAGYGQYGVLTERFCPSDGLVTERFAGTDRPASLWWSYNGWAAANVLEACARRELAARGGRQPL
jgi:hypothetical protein